MLTYAVNGPLAVEEFRYVLIRSTLAERRPIDDLETLRGMVENAGLTVTCRDGDLLVGVARSVTDFAYCCYLSDLAVDRLYQCRGIGRKLMDLTLEQLGPAARLILLAAPAAAD